MEAVSLIKPAEMTANETWHRELLFQGGLGVPVHQGATPTSLQYTLGINTGTR